MTHILLLLFALHAALHSALDSTLPSATRRPADAVTVWAVYNALLEQEGYVDSPADALRDPTRRQLQPRHRRGGHLGWGGGD